MKYTLYEVKNDDDAHWFIYDESEGWDQSRPLGELGTLERLSDHCDQNAESRNNHDFVGAHRILAALLFRQVGREQATAIMLNIAEHGGLDGMNGNGGEDDSYEEFGIQEPWHDWKLDG